MRWVYRPTRTDVPIDHGANQSVAPRSGRRLHRRIRSAGKTYREVDFPRHGIVRGEIALTVFADVEAFLTRLTWASDTTPGKRQAPQFGR